MSDKEELKKETHGEKEATVDLKQEETVSEEKDVDPKDEKIAAMQAQLQELEVSVNEMKNKYAKAYADTENMKKRLQKEFDSQKKFAVQSFALSVLPVLDDCERALSIETSDEAYRKGVEMIRDKLLQSLMSQGVQEIDAKGKPFDGNFHQALMSEHQDGVEEGIVIEVLQKGYMLHDRLLRAAMVKVSE